MSFTANVGFQRIYICVHYDFPHCRSYKTLFTQRSNHASFHFSVDLEAIHYCTFKTLKTAENTVDLHHSIITFYEL